MSCTSKFSGNQKTRVPIRACISAFGLQIIHSSSCLLQFPNTSPIGTVFIQLWYILFPKCVLHHHHHHQWQKKSSRGESLIKKRCATTDKLQQFAGSLISITEFDRLLKCVVDVYVPVKLGVLCLHPCYLCILLLQILSLNRVQAWPKPLNGAGLIQNLHQVADDVTVERSGTLVHEDG